MPILPLQYPESRFAPPAVTQFTDAALRARLSPGALKGFFRIMAKWGVRDEEARTLLGGGVSKRRFDTWRQDPGRAVLGPDQLTRISVLVGIYRALHVLHGATLADRWVTRPNRNCIFRGESALAYMLAGGLPGLQTVRRLLDARRGGE
jgi:hypothetical protein